MKDRKNEEQEYKYEKQPLPFLGRDATPEEIKEWDRLEDLRRYLHGKGRAATGRDRQVAMTHELHLYTPGCWLCGMHMSVYNAAKAVFLPEYGNREYRCNVRMHYTVPFVAWPNPWFWSRPTDMTPQEVIDTLEAARPLWEKT